MEAWKKHECRATEYQSSRVHDCLQQHKHKHKCTTAVKDKRAQEALWNKGGHHHCRVSEHKWNRAKEQQSSRAANFQSTKGAEHHSKKSTWLESTTVQENQSTWSTQCWALQPHSTRISGNQTNGEAKQQSITSSKQQKMKSSAPKHDSRSTEESQRNSTGCQCQRGGQRREAIRWWRNEAMEQWNNGAMEEHRKRATKEQRACRMRVHEHQRSRA